jgi:hypothetical protein
VSGRVWHGRRYHEWPSSTPVIDVVRTLIAVASVMIGSHAAIFLAIAFSNGDNGLVVKNALFFVGIAIANAAVDGVRYWRRHHA